MFRKLIGDRKFYKTVMAVTLPIIIQNGITNFVSLLDNIMVGALGTLQMSGVAIANQLIFVFNLAVFGAISGAGIFCAQFFGKNDDLGVAHTMRFKLYGGLAVSVIGIAVFHFFGSELLSLYLTGEGTPEDIAATLCFGKEYLAIMLLGLLPFPLVQCYAGTLRETGETVLPMVAGIVAVVVNLIGNYLLIFGKLGLPKLGAVGAAISTVISRFVELIIVVVFTHIRKNKHTFASIIYRSARIPLDLTGRILVKGAPIMVNELLWGMGMAALSQAYSTCGLHVVGAMNINSVISNLFNVVFLALGSSIAIIVGHQLGAGRLEEAVDSNTKITFITTAICLVMGAGLFFVAPYFPEIYNTEDNETVKTLASTLIRITALHMPIGAFIHSSYFTLRSGGKTLVTFFFDCGFTWGVSYLSAYLLTTYTHLDIIPIYATVLGLDIIKCFMGYWLVKKRIWVNNIVGENV